MITTLACDRHGAAENDNMPDRELSEAVSHGGGVVQQLQRDIHAITDSMGEIKNTLKEQDRVSLATKGSVERIERTLNGDDDSNVPGLKLRMDRLERTVGTLVKVLIAVVTVGGGAVLKVAVDVLTLFMKSVNKP